MTTETLLEVSKISKHFPGVKALDNVDFHLNAGSVHAVCGENGAGKSTLMNILMGVYQRDAGQILVRGKAVDFHRPKQALASGIAIIEQELNPVPEMTVTENLFLGREDTRLGFWIDYPKLHKKAVMYLGELGVEINPSTKMKSLSLAQIQLVEIAKAISYDSDVIIMDEPTSAIAAKDADRLFSSIEILKSKGKGIIYVSHRMAEIFSISDTVTVLRDGKHIGTRPTAKLTRGELVNMMIGRKLEEEYIKTNIPTNQPLLEVHHLSRGDAFQDISMTVHKGEILGIFGLIGAGRSEFFDALFGVDPAESGEIVLFGQKCQHNTPRSAIKGGLALVTEDRKKNGLVLQSSVLQNISLPSLRRLSKGIFIDNRSETRAVKAMAERFQVKTPTLRQVVARLSGGNQQKVVLSKWILTEPTVLLLDEPTRGIDVGAKRDIYAFISEFANRGNSVILISSEIPEVMRMSDRIVVFRDGRKVADCKQNSISQDELMRLVSEDAGKEE